MGHERVDEIRCARQQPGRVVEVASVRVPAVPERRHGAQLLDEALLMRPLGVGPEHAEDAHRATGRASSVHRCRALSDPAASITTSYAPEAAVAPRRSPSSTWWG